MNLSGMVEASDLRIPFAWEERRPVLLERFLYVPSFYAQHEQWVPLAWSDPRIFGNHRPVLLEYCSGNGQWICQKAKQHPDCNWVAVDKRFDRLRKGWVRLHRQNLSNLFLLCGEALTVTRHYMPKSSVAETFINFPDPWPKSRHAKHRLIKTEFFSEMAQMVVPGGRSTLVSDDASCIEQTLAVLKQCLAWRPILPFPHYVLDQPGYGDSFFSDLWKKKGCSIYFLPLQNIL